MTPSHSGLARARPSRGPRGRTISLYVHIPFCAARCPYCDFATAPARSHERARYLETLGREIRARGAALGRPRVRTLYLGGGTPSLLEPVEIEALADAVNDAFDLCPVEVTVEANPATLDATRLAAFGRLGLTRVSLGAQSLHPEGLRALARAHSVEDVARSARLVRDAGVRLNLDLIFGWPGETRQTWCLDLDRALSLGPDHLSCYPLTLAHEPEDAVANWPGGGWRALARWRARAQAAQPDDDALAAMYVDAERVLARAGFVHYEIANWARPGHRSRHNLVYWRDGEWLGVGVGAHSHLDGLRFWNSGRIDAYLSAWERPVDERLSDFADPPHRDRASSPATIPDHSAGAIAAQPGEAAMLALRLREGLRYASFARRYGARAADEVRARLAGLVGSGLLSWKRDGIALRRRGRLLSNEVFVRLV